MADVNIINGRIRSGGKYLVLYADAACVFRIADSTWPVGVYVVPVYLQINGLGNELTITHDFDGAYFQTISQIQDGPDCVPFYGAVAGQQNAIYIYYPPGIVIAGGCTDTLDNILTRSSPPPPYVPTGLVGWYDASVFSSLSLTGTVIDAIADLSGHGNHLGASPALYQKPFYSATGFNSRPTMLFGSVGTSLALTPFLFGTGSTLTCFYAGTLELGSSAAYARAISYRGAGTLDYDNLSSFFLGRNASTDSVAIGRNNSFLPSSIAAGYGTPRRVIATIAADGTKKIYVDGTAASGAATGGAFGNNGLFAIGNTGYGGPSGNGLWQGQLSELGISTECYDAAAVTALDTYLKNKWGL